MQKAFPPADPGRAVEGIKNALAYGYVCPMLQQDQPSNELMVPHRYWLLDENCQYLNIWTQHLDPNAKKARARLAARRRIRGGLLH